ncbi:MAG TPA: hypothetical protein VGK33_16215, partial [Chloroflexota bacterium]
GVAASVLEQSSRGSVANVLLVAEAQARPEDADRRKPSSAAWTLGPLARTWGSRMRRCLTPDMESGVSIGMADFSHLRW